MQFYYANATINICRICIPDSTHPNSAKQAVDGSVLPLGISGDAGRVRPDPDFVQSTVDVAALQGEPVAIYGNGEVAVPLYCNATWNPGDLIMADANAYGIVHTTGNFYVGRAQTAGVVGAYLPVNVLPGYN